jgi:hypothetical protein
MMDYMKSQHKYMRFLKIHMLYMTVTVQVYRHNAMNNIQTVLGDGAGNGLNC